MGNISVGIDTSKDRGKRSKGRRLIGVVIGKPSKLNLFTNLILATARENGYTGNLHWKHMKKNVRDKVLAEHTGLLKELRLIAFIFLARRNDTSKREHYLEECPDAIAKCLVTATNGMRQVTITSDTDFNSLAPGPIFPTKQFLRRLIERMAFETTGVRISSKHEGAGPTISFYDHDAQSVCINAREGSQYDFPVQAADIVLGMYSLARLKKKLIDCIIIKEV